MITMLDMGRIYRTYQDEFNANVADVLLSGQFIGGKWVEILEHELEQRFRMQHCICCASGTDALEIAGSILSLCCGLKSFNVPAFSFWADFEAFARHHVEFSDVDENFQLNSLRREFFNVAVELFGIPFEGKINGHCILDAAQSFDARGFYNDVDFVCLSFHPAKPLGCFGDGGAILTDNTAFANLARKLANHGQSEKYVHEYVGKNSRLDNLQAAILCARLNHVEEEEERRRCIAMMYCNLLNKNIKPTFRTDSTYSYFPVRLPNATARDSLQAWLKDAGIASAVHYPVTITNQPYFGKIKQRFPFAESIATTILCLPIDPYMSNNDVLMVVREVDAWYSSL